MKPKDILLEDFDEAQFVEKELFDKISLWILRIIIKLGAFKEFIDKNNYFREEDIAYFLGLGKYVNMDSDDFKRSEILFVLKQNYTKLEKKQLTTSSILTKNIEQISNLMNLNNTEKAILEFLILLSQHDILSSATDLLGSKLNTIQIKKVLSGILNIDIKEIDDALKYTSKLTKSSMITVNRYSSLSLFYKIEIDGAFAENMLNLDEDISEMLRESVRKCDKGTLFLKDYKHLSDDIDVLLLYLKNALEVKQKGVNILLYGYPGTGKTELAKTIASTLKIKLFEIDYAREDDSAIDGQQRLIAYKTAQALLSNQNILLMYDEAEDIFDNNNSMFTAKKQDYKAWLNRALENNVIPTIWITNDIHSIDNALVRRFDFSLEIPIPNRSKRAEIIKKYSNDILDEKTIKVLSKNENIAPALITRAAKIVDAIDVNDKSKVFTQILNNTLKAQGYKKTEVQNISALPNLYNPTFINTATDLKQLTQGIRKHQNARLCLYGPAGTGKSAFGRYIAETIDKPLLLKKGSDLISMWVGGTEKNIANAFEEAKDEKAVLIFDEVDSFLTDRRGANRSWEVTQVNEMLVQMENFNGIFIATTNLMDNLDQASLRRFDLKLEFDFLKSEQAWNIFLSYSKELKLSKPNSLHKKIVKSLRCLTPGDFAAIVRQNRFRPIENIKDFISRLEDEINIKETNSTKRVGFVS